MHDVRRNRLKTSLRLDLEFTIKINLVGNENFRTSAVHGPAWPESRGFGLAQAGSGFVKPQAKPKPPLSAWLRLGLAQAAAFEWFFFL